MAMLRIGTVKVELGHKSDGSVYTASRVGLFTKPVKIGERAVGWPSEEVDAINRARIAGHSKAQIRELVIHLHAKRIEMAMV